MNVDFISSNNIQSIVIIWTFWLLGNINIKVTPTAHAHESPRCFGEEYPCMGYLYL